MANIEQTLNVSVEATLHTAIKDFLQDIESKYGLQVHSLDIDWRTIRQIGDKPKGIITEIKIRTGSNY
jgi:hypothetical protein